MAPRSPAGGGGRAAAPTGESALGAPAELGTAERRLLAEMPLHAITSVHGEAGLRERLAIEIASFPSEDRERVERALVLASRLHAADRRQRERYVNRLLRVAIRIISHYGCAALTW